MTKNEFMGFSYEAQHNIVLEALERVTKNIEIIENESGRPFADTSKQRMNDIKLLTILADAFSKNELVWINNSVLDPDECSEKSKDKTWKPLPESIRRCNTKPVVGVVDGGKRMTLEEYVKEYIKENNKES